MNWITPTLLVTLFVTFGCSLPSSKSNRGLLFGLDNGELCLEVAQCSSGCCHHDKYLELARCEPLSIEGAACQSNDGIWDVYEDCPCEEGLKCKSSVCVDPNDS